MASARMVAVVVPSPATSLVLLAASFTSWAPMFSYGSCSSISSATVTPSLVTFGLPQPLSITALRPRGPSVARTALASLLTPASSFWRASSLYDSCFAAIRLLLSTSQFKGKPQGESSSLEGIIVRTQSPGNLPREWWLRLARLVPVYRKHAMLPITPNGADNYVVLVTWGFEGNILSKWQRPIVGPANFVKLRLRKAPLSWVHSLPDWPTQNELANQGNALHLIGK